MVSIDRMRDAEDKITSITDRLDQMQAQLLQQLGNANLAEASHQAIHKEVIELRKLTTEIDKLKTGTYGPANRNYNDKSLLPEIYLLEKSKWPSWSLKFRISGESLIVFIFNFPSSITD